MSAPFIFFPPFPWLLWYVSRSLWLGQRDNDPGTHFSDRISIEDPNDQFWQNEERTLWFVVTHSLQKGETPVYSYQTYAVTSMEDTSEYCQGCRLLSRVLDHSSPYSIWEPFFTIVDSTKYTLATHLSGRNPRISNIKERHITSQSTQNLLCEVPAEV